MLETIDRFYTVDLKGKGFEYIDVIFIGDAHAGHHNFDKKKFIESIEWVKQADNRYVVLMGDLIECLTKTHSPSAATPAKDPNDAQVRMMINWIKPIADRVLISIGGNHEERTIKSADFTILRGPMELMGIEYRNYQASLKIKLDNVSYNGYVHHGTGSSLKPDYQLRKFIYDAGKLTMDFVAMGHIHQEHKQTFPSEKIIGDRIVKHECLGIRTGGFLRHPNYAKKAGYPPPDITSPIIRFYNKRNTKLIYFSGLEEYELMQG